MLKRLFNRSSPLVRLMEIVGLVFSFLIIEDSFSHFDRNDALFLFLFFSYLFVRICYLIHWYRGEPRDIGIEVHFKKALVPISYILALTSILVWLDAPVLSFATVVLADLMMLVVIHVNFILIYFHLRDRDPLPINYFSLNKHLKNENV